MDDWQACPLAPSHSQSQDAFIAAFGSVYEHSTWVADSIWPRVNSGSIATFGCLSRAMADAVLMVPVKAKLDLICAHPELAGKAALAGELTSASKREQRGAGLDQCTAEELAQIQSLNARYRARFGFPFIIAVTGLTRTDIIAAMASRLEKPRDAEVLEALRQIDLIAAIRLAAIAELERRCPK